MNNAQKMVIAVGALLAALRAFFPVRYTEILGMRFEPSEGGMFQQVDWGTTGLHLGGILLLTVALVFIFKNK